MIIYEYTIVTVVDKVMFETELNRLGLQGWKCVHVNIVEKDPDWTHVDSYRQWTAVLMMKKQSQ